jgi:patatin-like phospholipase/acyl hydrolase
MSQLSLGPVPAEFTGQRFQVLSLDGGGAKALFTAHVLAHLERDLGIRVVDHFDLVAGTSAGGIVALGLGIGLSPAEIVEHYTGLIDRVFPRRRQRRLRFSRLTRPAYDGDTLREVLVGVLGDRVLGESSKRLLVPSWDVQSGQVHIFKTPHHERLARDWSVPMVDIALATSAAPAYFQAASVMDAGLIDGGVWANNPSVLAIAEAVSMLGAPLDAIRVLNIGTMDPFTDHSARLDNAGMARWATKAVPLILTASSRGGIGTARHLIGFEDFVRFDAQVPPNKFALDKIKASEVAGYASSTSRNLSPEFKAKFQDHIAPAYVPEPGRGIRPGNSKEQDH